MLAIRSWVIDAGTHHEREPIYPEAASATWTACPVIVADQLNLAQGTESLDYIENRGFGLV
jgi:hypothetical protein